MLQERDPPEGPIPHLETRLCVLLSIVPLAIANVLEDEAKFSQATATGYVESAYGHKMNGKALASRKDGLISSLQVLGNFTGLLCPPASVAGVANSAAAKASNFISISKNAKDCSGNGSPSDTPLNSGNLEVCIFFSLLFLLNLSRINTSKVFLFSSTACFILFLFDASFNVVAFHLCFFRW